MDEKVSVPNQRQHLQQMEAKIQAANALSRSLLFSLERQYLDVPFEEAKHIQPLGLRAVLLEEPSFLRLEQVGCSAAGSLHQPFTALQTALSAFHNPGRYTLLFVVSSDGRENRIYLGVRSHDSFGYPSEDFVTYLGRFLQGNWPGTRFRFSDRDSQTFKDHVLRPLNHDLRYAVALTGIPSLKPGDHPGYPQSLDRLLRGLRGLPFMYMIIAEPMAQVEVNEIIYRCRDLVGQVHALARTTLVDTLITGFLQEKEEDDFKIETRERSSRRSKEKNTEIGMDISKGMAMVGLVGLQPQFFPAAAFSSGVLSDESTFLKFNRSWQEKEEFVDTHTTSAGTRRSQKTRISKEEAKSFGQECLNAHAEAAETQLRQYSARFEQARASGCWNVGVYFLAKRPEVARQGATQLRALLSGEKSAFEPIRFHQLKRVWTKGVADSLRDFELPNLALVRPGARETERLEHPLGPAFNGLTTPLNTEELALLVNLPRRQVPGVRVMPTVDFSLAPPDVRGQHLELGNLLEGGEPTVLPYAISLNTLAKHVLVTGIAGSGKSATCRKLLSELRQFHIPFMVIEPARDKYVEWAMQLNKGLTPKDPDYIAVYIPGAQSWRNQKLEDELILNPFDIVWPSEQFEPRVLTHIDRLKSILGATFSMQEALSVLLEDALFDIYRRWLDDGLPPFNEPRPTLTQLVNQVQSVAKGKGYDESATANPTAALTTRIQSLCRGWKGRLFDQPRSTSWSELFDRPTVINLSRLGDDTDKAFTMAVLLEFLYEYRQARHELSTPKELADHPLRHLAVIDQAHRILSQPEAGLLDRANPQVKMVTMFGNMLPEMRAYGQGVLVVDQAPAKLAPDVIKNTNLKIIHRLVVNDDRDAMTGCTTLTAQQSAVMNRLKPGQAIVCSDLDDMAAWVQV